MPWGAAIGAAAAIGSAAISASASGSAGDTIAGANFAAIPQVQATQSANVASIQGNEAPYVAAGQTGVAGLAAGEAPGGQFSNTFNLSDLQVDPGYQFDLQQGNLAVQRSAAAGGTLNSGGTLKSLDNYTTGLASNEVSNAYNRFMGTQTQQYNQLYQLAGLGQTGVNQVNYAQNNQANTVSNAQYGSTIAAGAAQAAGQIGASNAISGGLQTLASNGTLSGLTGGGGTGTSLSDLLNFGSSSGSSFGGDAGTATQTANDANFLSPGVTGGDITF